MQVLYEVEARLDFLSMIDYGIERGFPDPVGHVRKLRQRIASLAKNPKQGRTGRVPGTRELVIAGTQHIAVYQIDGSAVRVLRVLHGAMQWPSDH